jgi:protein-disulfide isomerase
MTSRNSEDFPRNGGARRDPGRVLRLPWRSCALVCALAALLVAPSAAAQGEHPAPPPPAQAQPLATLAGEPIYENQLPPSEQAQLRRMMQQVFGVKRRALQTVLDQKLVEAEAKKKGVSQEELLKAEVDSKVADPSEEQVSAYYQAHQGQINQPYDDAKAKLREGLKTQEILKARQAYIQRLMQVAVNDGALVVMLHPPVIDVIPDPTRLRGNPKAPVTIVEFSDFSCPFCRKSEAILSELLAKYPDQVKIGYRDFPLRQIHPQAQLAAEASRCAGEQGKYWEYHDLLFANGDKLGRDDLLADARTLKLDDQKFDACLSSGRFKPEIEQDLQLGTRLGVVSTPAFFVNGVFLDGAQSLEVFEKMVKESEQP